VAQRDPPIKPALFASCAANQPHNDLPVEPLSCVAIRILDTSMFPGRLGLENFRVTRRTILVAVSESCCSPAKENRLTGIICGMDIKEITERLALLKRELADLNDMNRRHWSRTEHSRVDKAAYQSRELRLTSIVELAFTMRRAA
jgi:hypothetical protein